MPVSEVKACPHTYIEQRPFNHATGPTFILATGTLRGASATLRGQEQLIRFIVGAFHTWIQGVRKALMGNPYQNTSFGYIRSLEMQTRGSPHWHAILAIRTPIRCCMCDSDAICQDVYDRFQSLWQYGYSKFSALDVSYPQALQYVLKYVDKTSSARTVWRHVYSLQDEFDTFCTSRYGQYLSVNNLLVFGKDVMHAAPALHDTEPIYTRPVWFNNQRTHKRVKLLTASRNFPYQYFFQRVTDSSTFERAWAEFEAYRNPPTLD